jgi:hypothetical protein
MRLFFISHIRDEIMRTCAKCPALPVPNSMYCHSHLQAEIAMMNKEIPSPVRRVDDRPMSEKYPKYYKKIPIGMTEIDIYAVCQLFNVSDTSGAIHHAIKKLLLSGVRTGGKSVHSDIREARDTLNRFLQMHPEKLDATNEPRKMNIGDIAIELNAPVNK